VALAPAMPCLQDALPIVTSCGIPFVGPERPDDAIKHHDDPAAHVVATVCHPLQGPRRVPVRWRAAALRQRDQIGGRLLWVGSDCSSRGETDIRSVEGAVHRSAPVEGRRYLRNRSLARRPRGPAYARSVAQTVSTRMDSDRPQTLHCRHWCRKAGRHLGSASDSRVSDLTAGKLPPKLSGRIADTRGRQLPTLKSLSQHRIDRREAVVRTTCDRKIDA